MRQSDKISLRALKTAKLRVHIFKTAWHLMNASNDTAATVEHICEAAGVSRRTFFSYFSRKDDILVYAAKAWNSTYADQDKPAGLAGIAYLCRRLCDYNARYPEFLVGPISSLAQHIRSADQKPLHAVFSAVTVSSLEQCLLSDIPLTQQRPPAPTLLELLKAHILEAKSLNELQQETDETDLALALISAIYGATLIAAMKTDVPLKNWMEAHVFKMLKSATAVR